MKKALLFLLILWTSPVFASDIVGDYDTFTTTELVGYVIGDCNASINNYQYDYASQPTQVKQIPEGKKCKLKLSAYKSKFRSGYDKDENYITEFISRQPANLAKISIFSETYSGEGNCKTSSNCFDFIANTKTNPKGNATLTFRWSNNVYQYYVTARRKGTSDTATIYIKTLQSGE